MPLRPDNDDQSSLLKRLLVNRRIHLRSSNQADFWDRPRGRCPTPTENMKGWVGAVSTWVHQSDYLLNEQLRLRLAVDLLLRQESVILVEEVRLGSASASAAFPPTDRFCAPERDTRPVNLVPCHRESDAAPSGAAASAPELLPCPIQIASFASAPCSPAAASAARRSTGK